MAQRENTREVLRRFGLVPRHRLGQNFLVSPKTVERIISAASIGPEDLVIEVGPGIGTLTRALAVAAGRVVAVEIDQRLLPVLAFTLGAFGNVRIVHADVRKISLQRLAREEGAASFKVVANLPYYLTSVFLRKLLTTESACRLAVLMVQREVAERLLAGPGSRSYGLLTIAVQYYAEVSRVTRVGPEQFWPRPEVHSEVVRLCRRPQPAAEVGEEGFFFRLVRAAFAHRRKALLNSLSQGLGLSKEAVRKVLGAAGVAETARAENLSLGELADLSRAFLEEVRKG